MRTHDQPRSVIHHVAGDEQVTRDALDADERFAVAHLLDRRLPGGGGAHQDLLQVVGRRELNLELEQETVQLCLRQRVGTRHLDRVLRGDHEEWPRQWVPARTHSDGALLHGLQQRRLRLGRRAIDFVHQDQIGEDRPRLELEPPLAGLTAR